MPSNVQGEAWMTIHPFLTFLLTCAVLCTSDRVVRIAQQLYRAQYRVLLAQIAPQSSSGSFVRVPSAFLSANADNFPAGKDLCVYVGNPCPWCHRVTIAMALLKLQQSIQCKPLLADAQGASEGGWVLLETDHERGARDLRDVYSHYAPNFAGKFTAPLLVDKRQNKIVSNDSKDIIQILHRLWVAETSSTTSAESTSPCIHESGLYGSSATERTEIESYGCWLYENLSNAVYRAGFASSQREYARAAQEVSTALTTVDKSLQDRSYLRGDHVTILDIFLLPTVERFDAIYSCLFRCNGVRIAECSNIRRWHRDMRRLPGVRDTFDLADAVQGYYTQLFPLNPSGITPVLPQWQLDS